MESILRLAALKLFVAVFLWNAVGSVCVAETVAAIDLSVEHVYFDEPSNTPMLPTDFGFSSLDACFSLRYGINSTGRSFQKSGAEFVSVDDELCLDDASSDPLFSNRRTSWQFHAIRRHLIFCCLRN